MKKKPMLWATVAVLSVSAGTFAYTKYRSAEPAPADPDAIMKRMIRDAKNYTPPAQTQPDLFPGRSAK